MMSGKSCDLSPLDLFSVGGFLSMPRRNQPGHAGGAVPAGGASISPLAAPTPIKRPAAPAAQHHGRLEDGGG